MDIKDETQKLFETLKSCSRRNRNAKQSYKKTNLFKRIFRAFLSKYTVAGVDIFECLHSLITTDVLFSFFD